MAISSPAELLDWLAQFQFLSALQTDELRPLMATYADCRALATELIRRDWLTPFQVNQILTGKQVQLVLGDYRLRERIGEGAMGQVYKAWSVRLERTVAVKTIHKEKVNNPTAMDRFRREMEAAARLAHPNIALVRDADEVDGRPFLVMEYIDGFDLSRRVKKDGPLPIAEAVEYVRQAALGLQHAFERGIVHRDIKPANLMVATAKANGDSAPVVKILDFGLARYESERDNTNRLTQIGIMLGTIDYVAPEQATSSRTADIRADLYSLGCTLFYLLTGRPAFLGTTVVEKLGPRVTGEPPAIRELRPEVDPGLEAVLLKLMARRADDRYATPIEAAQALAPYVGAAPIAPPPEAAAPPPALPAGVMLAMPVAPTDIVPGNVPMALPILTMPDATDVFGDLPAPADEAELSFVGMTASGRDLSSGVSAAAEPTRSHAETKRPFPLLFVLLAVGSMTLSFLVCFVVWYFWFPKEPDGPKGSIVITKTQFSKPSGMAEPGMNKLLVWIKRVDFAGDVEISLTDLPPGVTCDAPMILKGNQDQDQMSFTVSWDVTPVKQMMKVVAKCEAHGIRAELPLLMDVGVPKKKAKS